MIRFDAVSYTYPFQDAPAVEDISFAVRPGELVLCTGASGCGKSTLMRLANGLCPQYYRGTMHGAVHIGGKSTTAAPLHELADTIGTLLQNPEEQFFALNVEEEIVFAHEWRGIAPAEIGERVGAVSHEFGLESILASSVHELSEGQKQKVGLASILSQHPRALILDEPTANLDPESTRELAASLDRLKKSGMAILVVDHRLYWLAEVADTVLVMENGRIAEQGRFSLLEDDALRKRYGLRSHQTSDPRALLPEAENSNTTTPRLEMADLAFGYPGKAPLFTNAHCSVRQGVTAVIGDNGAGKTTLARLLTGLLKTRESVVRLDGIRISPDRLLEKSGIVLQNADHQLYMRTALEEVATCLHLSGRSLEAKDARRVRAREILAAFGLETLAHRHPQSLSGGEKQRLVIACALAKKPDILILDEPTSGLDGRNMKRIAAVLAQEASRGTCVLVITHDLELMNISCTRALRLPLARCERTPGAPRRITKELP